MTRHLCLIASFFIAISTLTAQLQAPGEFLPHKLGEQFTPHYQLVDYVEHVAANSPNVRLEKYGTTYEGRPMMLAYISTPENLSRLEEIRENNLRRAGILSGNTDPSLDLAIVWLGYSVHGNEAAGSESSMAVLYELADTENARTQEWLENTVVIIDPSYNPDGYSRYTHWYRGISTGSPNANPQSWEHDEPWPGGRVNHYLFDLNRDWAWQTQKESRQRVAKYQEWFPHVHVDVHEQGYNSPYYFAPAAKPFHPYITKWQRDFQTQIGKNNAHYFDENGWLYFTRERFDLFYPSYGDTYPTYNGSIGMTYEQGGIGAGLAVETEASDTLTLADRILHHKTSSLATVETASKNADRLISQFETYFQNARQNPPGAYKTFIIKGDNPGGRIQAFRELLDRNGIRYGYLQQPSTLTAYHYLDGEEGDVRFAENDLVVSAYQPRGVLAQILLEPVAELEDSVTYDITAWSLPYAYGLDAYASKARVELRAASGEAEASSMAFSEEARPYAFLATWNSFRNARFLARLLQDDVVVRFASEPFGIAGKEYAPGTLVITRADNRDQGDRFFRLVREAAAAEGQELNPVQTGYSDNGHDLGSGAMEVIKKPRIALLGREGTYPNSFGQVWHYFEEGLGYPVNILPADDLNRINLEDFNVLILPEGRYDLNQQVTEKLDEWISGGGKLIAIGSAVRSLDDGNGFGLKAKQNNQNETDPGTEVTPSDYAGQERKYISDIIPGAVFKVDIDNSHPLAFGLRDYYFSLKTNELSYAPLERGWNVGTLGDELFVSGFAGARARENVKNSLIFGARDKGRGTVIFLIDNPLYRAFWESGKFLFSNAVFLAGQ